MPSFGVEDLDNTTIPALTIGLNRLTLANQSSAPKGSGSVVSSEDQSMDTEEENDKVGYMAEDMNTFRQLDYLWLFDSELRFSGRQGFTLDDAYVTAEDFKKMRQSNRRTLTSFLKEW